ncbi:MAG: T9SS type A sorting domain-containing protein [Bacteroidetes bacterium]|nr:T9SS type A sorting domain-containing protein [Bacteroidota bacterium]
MKKNIPLKKSSVGFLMMLLLLVNILTFAQTYNPPVLTNFPTCGTTDSMMIFLPKTQALNCTNSSAAYINKYSRQDFHIPNKATEPDITIKITFHVINNTSGSVSPWPGVAGVNELTYAAAYLDYYYSNGMYQPRSANYTAPLGCNYPNSNDPKVSFELTNIYQYYDNAMNTSSSGQAIGNYINSIDPNRMTEGFPIFINNAPFGYSGQLSSYNGRPAIHTVVNYNNNDAWYFGAHLKHEFGHVFGLYHTYRFNGSEHDFGYNCNHPDFLCDVFPVNNGACSAACQSTWLGCATCPEDNPNVGNGTSCNTLSSNNLMSGGFSDWISELQQGRIHRNLHLNTNNDLRFFVKEMNSDAVNPWLITSNEVWDFDIQMYNDIVVKPGATLTIKCKVGMANHGKIIVERGARLIIDGGEVYPWGTNWQGIEVWGTANKRQFIATNGLSVDHGIVNIINQGTINSADEGITTAKYDNAGSIDWTGAGGIIRCDNAKFINCWRAIQYMAYHNFIPTNGNRIDNIGYINNSIFETNSIRKDPAQPYPNTFISLWEVDGVKFYGNTYKNTVTSVPSIQDKGVGIYSIDASYYIDRYKVCSAYGVNGCTNYSTNNPSTFTNLNYGIYVSNALPASAVRINDNDFVNCNRAVYFEGSLNTSVTNNRINVGAGFSSQQYLPYGIYSNYSSGYDVSNNIIKSTNGTYNTNLATGICINGSNAVTNRLYRNTMNNVNVGTTVYGDNQGTNIGDGLSILCNSYGQGSVGLNQTDINMGAISFTFGKINVMQGSTALGANNLFSHNATPLTTCIKNDFLDKGPGCYPSSNLANTFNYFFNPAPANLTKPLYYSTSLLVKPPIASSYDVNAMCPVVFGGSSGGGTFSHKSVAAAKQTIVITTASVSALLAMVDGGNTQTLLTAINSQSPGNLKNLLESKSPYLSDAVLMAYFAKTSTPPGHVKEIHDKNKPVSEDVWQVILNRNLPNGIMNQLNNQQSVTTINQLVKLQAQVSDLKQAKGFIIDETIRQLMADSVNGWSADSIIDLMDADNRYLANQKLLAAYIAFDKLTQASALLNTIKNNGNGLLNDFCQLQALILDLKQQNKNITDIKKDGTFRKTLEQMAGNTSNAASVNAEAILKFVFNTNYYEYLSLPNVGGNSNRMMNNADNAIEVTQSVSLFKLYPNPANQSVTVQFIAEEAYSSKQMIVYDITGKVVISQTINDNLEIININHLTSGIYLVTMVSDGKVIGKQKLIKE